MDVITIPNEEDLLWYVARNVVGRLGFVDCVIYRANAEETELTQVAALGDKNPFGRKILNPLKIKFGEGITGRVAATRRAVIIDDLAREEGYIADTQLARSEICVPMMFGDRVVGVIDSEHPTPGAFGAADQDVLVTVSAMTSAKLELLEEAERSRQRYEDLVRSHAALTRETSNRRALETQLADAQKHESIGRLAGGFAHDFNNLLTVVSGNLDFLRLTAPAPESAEFIEAAQAAAGNAATLVQKMLQYSQQSLLTPELLDLDALIRETCGWSKQALSAGVSLELDLAQNLRPIKADRNGLENALLNLILNAKEAMPKGGALRIATQSAWLSPADVAAKKLDLAPGPYAEITVSDCGEGIAPDAMPRIFDPFYTTKAMGGGTGLGLSTVRGFMQQSGGAVCVSSTGAEGTTFCLYFPTWNHMAHPPA
ncbi:MAG: ATP-binding protein [Pseudomonadota bacterium]